MKKSFYVGFIFIGLLGFFLVRIYTFDHQEFVKNYLDKSIKYEHVNEIWWCLNVPVFKESFILILKLFPELC